MNYVQSLGSTSIVRPMIVEPVVMYYLRLQHVHASKMCQSSQIELIRKVCESFLKLLFCLLDRSVASWRIKW